MEPGRRVDLQVADRRRARQAVEALRGPDRNAIRIEPLGEDCPAARAWPRPRNDEIPVARHSDRRLLLRAIGCRIGNEVRTDRRTAGVESLGDDFRRCEPVGEQVRARDRACGPHDDEVSGGVHSDGRLPLLRSLKQGRCRIVDTEHASGRRAVRSIALGKDGPDFADPGDDEAPPGVHRDRGFERAVCFDDEL